MSLSRANAAQLGFEALLERSDRANAGRQVERDCAHLPETMDEALPFYRSLIERHHAAMLAGDADAALVLHREAHRLAFKLNSYEPGICAGDGTVPLWGQSGTFEITVGTMGVRIEIEGLFGICSGYFVWPGFSVHAVELDRPFLSETGYRSFLGLSGTPEPGLTPDRFTAAVIAAHVRHDLKGRLYRIR